MVHGDNHATQNEAVFVQWIKVNIKKRSGRDGEIRTRDLLTPSEISISEGRK